MRVALIGNPNSGKTTMYNALTGKLEKVGNWAGVTVDKKENPLKKSFNIKDEEFICVDLPGAYSMSPFTSEESITSAYVKDENPDVIINIVDGTNLSRSLFFTTQLLELGIPVVVALNKSDLNEKKGTKIDDVKLSDILGCPVVKTKASEKKNNGLQQVVDAVIDVKGKGQKAPYINEKNDYSIKANVEIADRKRFEYVSDIIKKVEEKKQDVSEETWQDKLDSVLINKWLGIPIFAIVMYLVFNISQASFGPYIAEWLTGWIDTFQSWAWEAIGDASPFLQSILIDGIIGGVGAVIGFLPLVMVMYFLISLLEDCGYMARVSVIMDPIFKRVGLSGKSIIPMVIGTGCAIPGVMACRTIRNERERRTTAMLTPFMPCGAKLPVIGLFAGVFFNDAGWVGTVMYFVGIILIFLCAWLVQRITGNRYRKSFFIMELPEYKMPSLKRAIISMFSRAKSFIIKAGTIILVCNAAVQIMQTFNWRLKVVPEGMEGTSILATIASPFAVLFIPLGFGIWQLAAATITGFIAKENVVGTLAVVFAVTNFINVDTLELTGGATTIAEVMGLTSATALAYLMFNLFTPPCFAALGAMNSEMGNKKWLWAGIGLQFSVAYVLAFLVNHIGTFILEGHFNVGFIPGLIIVIGLIAIYSWLIIRANKRIKQEYSNKIVSQAV